MAMFWRCYDSFMLGVLWKEPCTGFYETCIKQHAWLVHTVFDIFVCVSLPGTMFKLLGHSQKRSGLLFLIPCSSSCIMCLLEIHRL
jgi:hypothetical protein